MRRTKFSLWILILVGMALASTGVSAQTPWYVDDDNCPAPGSGTEADPFCAIQACIDATVDGDECIVAPGTYNEVIDFDGKAITLHSSAGADVTTIDGTDLNDSVVRCTSGEGPDTVLDGFTITGGDNFRGGGMLNWGASPTVTNCTFTGNSASNGGGIFNGNDSSPTVSNCTFSENYATSSQGGGMYNHGSSPTVSNCTFSENYAPGHGGGMANRDDSDATVTNCTFVGNAANSTGGGMDNRESSPTVTDCTFSGNTAWWGGGGMHNREGSDPVVTNCTFEGNSAGESGGGMRNSDSSPTVTGCTFSWNTSGGGGGGMDSGGSGGATVTNCTFIGNSAESSGGGIDIGGSNSTVTNCTFTGNSAPFGGGMLISSGGSPTAANCIFWGNAPNQILGVGSVSFSDIQGGYPGEGNINANPRFAMSVDDSLRLLPDSPCIDAADNEAVPGGIITDLDGYARFVDHLDTPDTGNDDGLLPIVDMGAYEFGSQDCNNNDILDSDDIADGSSEDCNENGIPDECEPDCNENGVSDGCDITDGSSQDCNVNASPDECDLADGTSEDCNANAIPDECDIAGGTSPDCNTNGIPDECEGHPLFTSYVDCVSGPDGGVPSDCEPLDFDVDDDVDLLDFGSFQIVEGGGVTITAHPQGESVCGTGETIVFQVQAAGFELSYQWWHGVQEIPGATDPTLVIEQADQQDSGAYRCDVTSSCGRFASSDLAELVVSDGPPMFETHPVGATLCAGDGHFMFASASGMPSYQWYKDDQPIPGATQTFFVITDATSNDAGVYHVVANNACESDTSDDTVVEVIDCLGTVTK